MRVGRQTHAGLGHAQLVGGRYFVLLKYAGQQHEPEAGDQLLSDARAPAGAERQKVFGFPDALLPVRSRAPDESTGVERARVVPVSRAGVQLEIVDDHARALGDLVAWAKSLNRLIIVRFVGNWVLR